MNLHAIFINTFWWKKVFPPRKLKTKGQAIGIAREWAMSSL